MTNSQLNPFEIKTEITKIIQSLNDVSDFENYEIHYRKLDLQEDKNIIVKLLFKEVNNSNINYKLLKFLLLRYCPIEELVEKLWGIIKNNMSSNQAKIFALDLLRDIDTNWSYEECENFFDNPDELVNSDTKQILDNAILNPEIQIDFLDFIQSLENKDKLVLINSLAEDYSNDELANMLIPVFLSQPTSEAGKLCIDLLGNSKSQLAYHALNDYLPSATTEIQQLIKKNISVLLLSGVREDNTVQYYKEIFKNSKPYRFCITYPDGHGNQAVIVSRINSHGKIQFVAIVIDDYKGIKDCFGFNEISKFECNTIIERFYKGQRALEINPEILKAILKKAEALTKDGMPYEYACWRNLLIDIQEIDLETEIINNLKTEKNDLNNKEINEILTCDFTDFWFLNSGYSDEFDEFIELTKNSDTNDFDKLIEDNIGKIFFSEEENIWHERLLNTAILKYLSNDIKIAQNLYIIYNNKNLTNEVFKNIIRKSIYEYYFAINDTERVRQIEDMWVK